jgi:hypothetical protein
MFKGNAAVAIIKSINTVKEVGRMEIAPNIYVDPQTHHGAPVITAVSSCVFRSAERVECGESSPL